MLNTHLFQEKRRKEIYDSTNETMELSLKTLAEDDNENAFKASLVVQVLNTIDLHTRGSYHSAIQGSDLLDTIKQKTKKETETILGKWHSNKTSQLNINSAGVTWGLLAFCGVTSLALYMSHNKPDMTLLNHIKGGPLEKALASSMLFIMNILVMAVRSPACLSVGIVSGMYVSLMYICTAQSSLQTTLKNQFQSEVTNLTNIAETAIASINSHQQQNSYQQQVFYPNVGSFEPSAPMM